jgi:hypothetical protein
MKMTPENYEKLHLLIDVMETAFETLSYDVEDLLDPKTDVFRDASASGIAVRKLGTSLTDVLRGFAGMIELS